MKRLTVAAIAAGALLLTLPALSEEVTALDRFKLWDKCQPMDLVVEGLPEAATEIGLTEEAITTAVRSRLRAARLYEATRLAPYLYVNVLVVGPAYNISVQYEKRVFDTSSAETSVATTWDIGGTGTHGRDSGYILSWVSRYIDKFIDEYLRVNADACAR